MMQKHDVSYSFSESTLRADKEGQDEARFWFRWALIILYVVLSFPVICAVTLALLSGFTAPDGNGNHIFCSYSVDCPRP